MPFKLNFSVFIFLNFKFEYFFGNYIQLGTNMKTQYKSEIEQTNINQSQQEIDNAWELLFEHLRSCEDWGNGCRVIKEDFIGLGKKEFIIIPLR